MYEELHNMAQRKTLEMQNCVRGIIYLVMSQRFHYFCANFATCRPDTTKLKCALTFFHVTFDDPRESRGLTRTFEPAAQAMNEMWIFVCKSCIRIARDRQRDRLKFFPFNGQRFCKNKILMNECMTLCFFFFFLPFLLLLVISQKYERQLDF